MAQQLAQRAARAGARAGGFVTREAGASRFAPGGGGAGAAGAGREFGEAVGRGFGGRYGDGPEEKREKPIIHPYPPAQSYVPTRYRGSYADVFRHTIMTHLLQQVNENERCWTFYDLYSGPPSQTITRTPSSHIYREPRIRGIDRIVEWARDTKTVDGEVMASNKLKKGHVFDTLLDTIRTVNATYKPLYMNVQSEVEALRRAEEGFPDLDESRYQTRFGLRSRLSNNFNIYPGNFYFVKNMMRKHDRAVLLEGSATDYRDLQHAQTQNVHFNTSTSRIIVWERYPSDGVVTPHESPIKQNTNIVDVLAGPVNTSQPIVWIDMGEHVDLKQVCYMPNTTTPEVRDVVNAYALHQRGKELFDTLEPEDVDALIGPRGPDEMTDGEKAMQEKQEREERGELREDWMPDFDNLVDIRYDEEIEQYELFQEKQIEKNRKLRAGQMYMTAIAESQEKVIGPGWNRENQGLPYNQYQHDRNWIATEYARKFLKEDPTSIICITYPIYDHKRPINLYRDLLRTGVRSAVTADFMFEAYRPELDGEYSGIGIVIANPPELFEYKLQEIVDAMEAVIQKRHKSGDLEETKNGTHLRVPRVAWLSPVQNGDVEVSDTQLTLREPHETLRPSATNKDLREVLKLDPKVVKKNPNPDAGMGVRKTIQIREFVQRLHMMDESIAKRKQEAFFNDLTSFIQTQETIQVPGHITHTPATTSLSTTTRTASTSSTSDATQSVTSTTSKSTPSSTS